MRKSFNPYPIMSGDTPYGIFFGADYCAEHEWGIRGIHDKFGIQEGNLHQAIGLKARQITKHDRVDFMRYEVDGEKVAVLYTKQLFGDYIPKKLTHLPSVYNNHIYLQTQWDERDFEVTAYAYDKMPFDPTQLLEDLYNAFLANDVAIWVGGGVNAFDRGGLVIVQASKVPEALAKQMEDADIDRRNLLDAVAATKIEERLAAAGKRYYALAPYWHKTHFTRDRIKTAHHMVFWLNPMDQQLNNYGWVSIEDLEQWIEGKGGIPKEANVEAKCVN